MRFAPFFLFFNFFEFRPDSAVSAWIGHFGSFGRYGPSRPNLSHVGVSRKIHVVGHGLTRGQRRPSRVAASCCVRRGCDGSGAETMHPRFSYSLYLWELLMWSFNPTLHFFFLKTNYIAHFRTKIDNFTQIRCLLMFRGNFLI